MKKIAFITIWLVLLVIPVYTLIKVTPLSLALSSRVFQTNYIERGLALLAFTMMFVQIILGSYMTKLTKKLGDWIFTFHVFEGRLIYMFVFLHPVFYLLSTYFAGGKFDPYVAFVNACLICGSATNYYLTIGRISFWLMTLAVFAAIFRKTNSWFVANWRKFHVLNYIVFLAIGVHGFFLGSDFRYKPFYYFAVVAYLIILGIIVFKEIPRLYKNFRNWVNS